MKANDGERILGQGPEETIAKALSILAERHMRDTRIAGALSPRMQAVPARAR